MLPLFSLILFHVSFRFDIDFFFRRLLADASPLMLCRRLLLALYAMLFFFAAPLLLRCFMPVSLRVYFAYHALIADAMLMLSCHC